MLNVVELTITEKVVPAVSVLASDGSQTDFDSLSAAMNAAQNGDTIQLNKDVTVNTKELDKASRRKTHWWSVEKASRWT